MPINDEYTLRHEFPANLIKPGMSGKYAYRFQSNGSNPSVFVNPAIPFDAGSQNHTLPCWMP